MKKLIVIILVVAIIAGVATYIYRILNPIGCESYSTQNLFETTKYFVEIEDGKKTINYPQYRVNAIFPRFTENDESSETEKSSFVLKDKEAAHEINVKIENTVNPYIDELKVLTDTDEELAEDFTYVYNVSYERYDSDRYKSDEKNEEKKDEQPECRIIKINKDVERARYVSLVVHHDFITNGLRTNNWKETYVVDVENSKLLKLSDLIDSNDYKKAIVKEINKQAKERNIKLLNGNELKDISDEQKFYINDEDKLIIYFEPAAITSYLNGDIEFEMPFKLEDHKFVY